MNSSVGSAAPSGNLASSTTTPEVSLFRPYTWRVAYFVMAAGLGAYIWPLVIHHTDELAITKGAQLALLAGLGATAALGLRYPVKMLPILQETETAEGDNKERPQSSFCRPSPAFKAELALIDSHQPSVASKLPSSNP